MNQKTEDEFEDIAQEAIGKAERVKCSLSDFADGLKAMIATLTDRWNGVRSEIGGDEG